MRRLTSVPAARRGALATLAAAGVTMSMSGCMYFSDAQTDAHYVPSDGTISNVGSVQLSNVLVVTTAKGAKGSVQGLATNNSDQAVELTVTPQGGTAAKVSIPPMTSVRLDGKANGNGSAKTNAIAVATTPVAPGAQMRIVFATASGGQDSANVPVLLDQAPYGSAKVSEPAAEG
ncbi:hypothetical protein GCM10027579_11260 [Calidifontibacter terrae]